VNLVHGLGHLISAAKALPSAATRNVVREAWRIERALPQWLAREPLPQLMQHLDEEARVPSALVDAPTLRRLADAAVALDHNSPLGLCLRRALVRYVLLRRAGVKVVVHFGARKETSVERSRIAGHAWLTLDSLPYAEEQENYQGFAVVYSYPASGNPNFPEANPQRQTSLSNL
jgi:hypothetical protein